MDEARGVVVPPEPGVDLHWIPLGAGGVGYVRFNGRAYEWVKARREHRPARPLYHTALEVQVPSGRFVVENAWPSPDADTASRGVVFEGPVFSRRLARVRPFRYEVRCWRDGVIADLAFAVETLRVTDDPDSSRHLLDSVTAIPKAVWGRDEAGVGEMWNSNSVISFLLTVAGFDAASMAPPDRGDAPGWRCGIAVARAGLVPSDGG
jgi:hypothetical protein